MPTYPLSQDSFTLWAYFCWVLSCGLPLSLCDLSVPATSRAWYCCSVLLGPVSELFQELPNCLYSGGKDPLGQLAVLLAPLLSVKPA